MNTLSLPGQSIFRTPLKLVTAVACGMSLWFGVTQKDVLARNSDVPWECSEYAGEAQTRCMHTLLELQQDKISRLEERLKTQEETVNDLKDRLDRQADLARREAKSSDLSLRYLSPIYVPSHTPYYGYSPLTPSAGIYLGAPWRFSRPFYGYGSRFWGGPGLSFHFRFGGGHRHRHR